VKILTMVMPVVIREYIFTELRAVSDVNDFMLSRAPGPSHPATQYHPNPPVV
jgi:hypothetical protein